MARKSKKPPLHKYPRHLRGFSNNRYGGHKSTNLKAYGRDWKRQYPCHTYSDEERRELQAQYDGNKEKRAEKRSDKPRRHDGI